MLLPQIAEFFAKSVEHARLGDAHRARAHAKVSGDILGSPAIDRSLPKSLPGALLELSPNHGKRAPEQGLLLSACGFGFLFRLGRGKLCEPPLGVGATHSSTLASESPEMIMHFVAQDRAEPTAEGIALAFLPKGGDVCHHGLENLLADIGDVLILQIPAPAPVKDQRGVESDQPVPRGGLIDFDPL